MISYLDIKKLKKLLESPDLFFFDLFRKRLEKKNKRSIAYTRSSNNWNYRINLDQEKLTSLGVFQYIKDALGSRSGIKDRLDHSSLSIEQRQIKPALELIDAIRSVQPLRANIYSLDGHYHFKAHPKAFGLYRKFGKDLSMLSDFVIELANFETGDFNLIHFFVGESTLSGELVLRSNNVLAKKLIHNVPPKEEAILDSELRSEPIDAVYTWVNSLDIEWQAIWQREFPGESYDADRYTNHQELRYSLRSLRKYAPWLNKIYIVSNCAPPKWLRSEVHSIEWVYHEQIFPDASMLPNFNSHAIECCLHRIKNLSEKFIYFNDDFFLSQPCRPTDFFDEHGRTVAYFESYGIEFPDHISAETPDYISAAKNSSQLIYDIFLFRPIRLHKHVPYALKRSILEELDCLIESNFQNTRRSKIRSNSDINVASFLFHHYSSAMGHTVSAEVKNFTAKPKNIRKIVNYGSIPYKFICINDGGNSSQNTNYKSMSKAFFLERYSEKAPWESDE